MSVTYRQHQDTRDGKIYNCVLMPDGKWWSAENLAWDGAGVDYNNDPALGAIYGRNYSWAEATSSCPTGSHTPSRDEYASLLSSIPSPDGTKLKANSSLWSTNTGTDDYGFKTLPGGNAGYFLGEWATFWTSTALNVDDGYQLQLRATTDSAIVTNQSKPQRNSVRFIVDVFNEPNPLQLFGAPFQGFERGLSCTIKRQILVDDSMGGSVVLTPVAPAAFDEWAIEAELWVSAAQAQALEEIVPPRGVPLENAIRLPPRGGEASFPGLLPFAQSADYDQYLAPMVTAFESLGQRAVGTDLFGYRIALSFFAEADGLALNGSPTPTTTPPTWLAGKASLRTIVDASNQGPVVAATTLAGHPSPRGSFFPVKHGRNLPVSIALDNLPTDWASELVAYFRGVRHNATTLQISNGPSGVEAVSVYLVGLTFARTGLTWSGSLEVVPA